MDGAKNKKPYIVSFRFERTQELRSTENKNKSSTNIFKSICIKSTTKYNCESLQVSPAGRVMLYMLQHTVMFKWLSKIKKLQYIKQLNYYR